MNPSITIDTRSWQAAARELQKHTSRTLVEFTNGQAYRVVTLAIKWTEKANRKKIEALMSKNVSPEILRGGRAGKRGWVNVMRTKEESKWRGTVAALMALAYRRKHGEWPVMPTTGNKLGDYARRLAAVKSKSVGMMKAGWINAANQLRRVVYKLPPGTSSLQSFGKRSGTGGYAIPAKFSLFGKIEALAVNEAPGYQRSKRIEKAWTDALGNPMPVLVRGLKIALAMAEADMRQHLAKKLGETFKPFSVR